MQTTFIGMQSLTNEKLNKSRISNRVKCYNYSKGHYCEKFHPIYSAKNTRLPLLPKKPLLPLLETSKTQFLKKSHCTKKPKTFKIVKHFFHAEKFPKTERVPFDQIISFSEKTHSAKKTKAFSTIVAKIFINPTGPRNNL